MNENEIYEIIVQLNKEKGVEFVVDEADKRKYVGKVYAQGYESDLECFLQAFFA